MNSQLLALRSSGIFFILAFCSYSYADGLVTLAVHVSVCPEWIVSCLEWISLLLTSIRSLIDSFGLPQYDQLYTLVDLSSMPA